MFHKQNKDDDPDEEKFSLPKYDALSFYVQIKFVNRLTGIVSVNLLWDRQCL